MCSSIILLDIFIECYYLTGKNCTKPIYCNETEIKTCGPNSDCYIIEELKVGLYL